MTNKKIRLVPAIARLDARPRKPTKAQRMSQQRQAAAWQRKAGGQQR
jgi:hypothetical protein